MKTEKNEVFDLSNRKNEQKKIWDALVQAVGEVV